MTHERQRMDWSTLQAAPWSVAKLCEIVIHRSVKRPESDRSLHEGPVRVKDFLHLAMKAKAELISCQKRYSMLSLRDQSTTNLQEKTIKRQPIDCHCKFKRSSTSTQNLTSTQSGIVQTIKFMLSLWAVSKGGIQLTLEELTGDESCNQVVPWMGESFFVSRRSISWTNVRMIQANTC